MDELVQKTAIVAVKRIFNDTTVDKDTTKDRLTEVAEEIEMLLNTLS